MAYTKIEDLPEITELSPTEELIIQTPTGTKRIKANLLKDEELAQKVNELDSSLNGINVYVSDDGKLHFVDKDGADSVLNFSSEAYPYGSVGRVGGTTNYTGGSGSKEFAENSSTLNVPKNVKSIRFDFFTSSSSGASTVSINSFTILSGQFTPIYDSGWKTTGNKPATQARTIVYGEIPQGSYSIKIKAGYASSQTSSLSWAIESNAVVSTQPKDFIVQ